MQFCLTLRLSMEHLAIILERRRAFSMRFIGDDVRYLDRGGETSPPFKGINLKTGDTLRTDWFPVVWSK